MSNDVELLERDTFAVLDRFFAGADSLPYRRLRRRVYANHWMILAGSYNHAGRQRDAIRCGLRAMQKHPASLARIATTPLRQLTGARAGAMGETR